MTSWDVKLCFDVENYEYIVPCNFAANFEFIEFIDLWIYRARAFEATPCLQEAKNKKQQKKKPGPVRLPVNA